MLTHQQQQQQQHAERLTLPKLACFYSPVVAVFLGGLFFKLSRTIKVTCVALAIQAQTAEQPAPSRGRLTWRTPVLFGDCRGAEPFERSACPSLPPRLPAPPPKTNTQTCPPIQILVGRSSSAILAVPAPSSSPDSAGGQFGRDRVRSERPGLVYAVVGSRLRETSGKLAGGQDNRSVIQRSKLLTIKLNVYTTFTLHCCQMWLFICFVWWTLSQSNCIANKYGE